MEQPTESGDISIRNLAGLNQRLNPLDLPPNEFSLIEGYYPSQQGLLSRLPGKEKIFQLQGRIMSIHPTYNSSGHVLIQTKNNLYLSTVDEIQGRVATTNLTINPNPDPGGGSSGDGTPPTQPTNLVASSIGSGSLTLTWTPSTDEVGVTSYTVYYRISPAAFAVYGIATTNSISVVGLTDSTTYDFYVEANDAAGNISIPSAVITASTPTSGGDVTPPTTPGSLSLVSSTTTSIGVTWTASTDAVGVTGYIIYSRIGTTGSFTQAGTVATITFTATGLLPNTSYDFQVKAFDAAGNISSASNTLSAITQDGGIPIPAAAEILIYFKRASGVEGSGGSGSGGFGIPISDISIPSNQSSFLISNNANYIVLPAGSYLFDGLEQIFTTDTGVKTYASIYANGATLASSNTCISPASDISALTKLSITGIFSASTTVFLGITINTGSILAGKEVNLGEIETYMILRIVKLA